MEEVKRKSHWTSSDMPPQTGRLIVVTGTGGLGYECALASARAGADIILAGRNRNKGEASIAKVRSSVASANIRFEQLDLADLASIEEFGRRLRDTCERVDVLINNAAVIMTPRRQVTKDGFELHFGTNYLGHFALTAYVMPLLRKGRDPRVVSVCALAANRGAINFGDLQSEHRYAPMAAYGLSKLASLMFSLEFHRRSIAGQWGIKSIAAHPGLARTDSSGLRADKTRENRMPFLLRLIAPLLFQPPEQGALPLLFAATSAEAESGGYYGPDGSKEMKGFPAHAKIPPDAKDETVAKRLWDVSKQMTHVGFEE
ncbi:SDR family oxidoreductase [Bradyrhizobium genosp. P]|uniref:SDR family oxidoreductase n=1 Tax=Bradyrhizobium genosp. P TaxID=83641 RepID=UPI003CF66DCC